MNRSEAGTSIRYWAALGGMTLALAVVASGCNALPTQANLFPCSGSYTGTYSGAGGGKVTGSLTAAGDLDLSFTPTNTASGTGFGYHVTGVHGAFAGHNPDDISASFDLASCRISGLWVFHGDSGVWSVSIQRSP